MGNVAAITASGSLYFANAKGKQMQTQEMTDVPEFVRITALYEAVDELSRLARKEEILHRRKIADGNPDGASEHRYRRDAIAQASISISKLALTRKYS